MVMWAPGWALRGWGSCREGGGGGADVVSEGEEEVGKGFVAECMLLPSNGVKVISRGNRCKSPQDQVPWPSINAMAVVEMLS